MNNFQVVNYFVTFRAYSMQDGVILYHQGDMGGPHLPLTDRCSSAETIEPP
jgi:hypothetical protein